MRKWISTHRFEFALTLVLIAVISTVGLLMYTGRLNYVTQAASVPEEATEELMARAIEEQGDEISNLVDSVDNLVAVLSEPAAQAPVAEEESIATPASPPPAQPEQEVDECLPGITTEQAQTMTGVSVQRIDTECSAWVWRGVDQATTVATCPSGWVCTWDIVNDVVVVHMGIGQNATIHAGTFRKISAYPADDSVRDICELFRKERALGQREVPSFEVRFQPVPGGVQQCS